jgi:CheY-like chemotaxis protein
MSSKPVTYPRIVIVDDEQSLRATMVRLLSRAGHEVVEAADGEAALAAVARAPGALLLLDVEMPGMNGVAVCDAARVIDPTVQVVVVTGNPGSQTTRELCERRISALIEKPFSVAGFVAAISRVLLVGAARFDVALAPPR